VPGEKPLLGVAEAAREADMIRRSMWRFVMIVPLKRGSGDEVRRILADGLPYALGDTSLERHFVFQSSDELVFLFEGEHADQLAKALIEKPALLLQESRLGRHMGGSPRVPEEVFSWERPEALEGVSFAPEPGPGDSEGGGAD
jgi:hypothetical protein